MTRDIILGNRKMLVCLDKNARIRDFYYPHVGEENHVSSKVHRIGVWAEGKFSWVSYSEWDLSIKYKKDSLVSEIVAYNHDLEIELKINEAVHSDKSIYLRKVEVVNKGRKRKVKVFFSQEFQVSESNIGDTVYFDPVLEALVNYKGRRYFLMSGESEGKPFSEYATGVSGANGKEGTYLDAEDGFLSKNAIEHGSVDSAMGFELEIEKDKSKFINYWICVGKSRDEVSVLNDFVLKGSVEKLIGATEKYWKEWLAKSPLKFPGLDDKVTDLFKRSLLIIRAQTDDNGAIIASNDTDTFKFKKDTYSYMWPRDGALVARSFDKAGYYDITHKFFQFCSQVVEEGGYLLPKYRPDGSVGSSWHSWLKNGEVQLPIQEDETALVLDALWKHYKRHKFEDMKEIYEHFVKKAGDFLYNFRDEETKLPKESYDLWEEKLGIHTFTCATVYAGLEAAKNFAEVFGDKESKEKFGKGALEVKESILKYLYDPEEGLFIKGLYYDKDWNTMKDKTLDISSVYGIFEYKILDATDERVVKSMEKTLEKLWCVAPCGGVARYENDKYYRAQNSPENPWYICTFWLAEYYIAKAKKIEDLKPAQDLMKWATERALPSGILSEQLNPYTGESLSVSPLTWSHAGFIISVIKYIDKVEELKGNKKV